MQILKPLRTVLLLGICGGLIFLSCEELPVSGGPVQPTPDPISPQDVDLDRVSEFLVVADAQRISGSLGPAPDGQIKLDIEDTIFSVKGYPLGNRINVLKQSFQDITGYYVGLIGASYYYDVPETIIEGQFIPSGDEDTSSVIVLDLDPPEEIEGYPFSVEVVIQPHDPSGQVLDEFVRTITVEDPDDRGECNSITLPSGSTVFHWEWDFTIRAYNGEILNVFAPGLASPINSQGAGCCTSAGVSLTTSDSPLCNPNVSSPDVQWVPLEVDDYSVRTWELWWIYDDGTLKVRSNWIKKQYDRASTNFCTGEVGYTIEEENSEGEGMHDFTPGSSQLGVDFSSWTGPYRPLGGELVYTCHTMIISWGVDDNYSAVYRIWDSGHNIFDFQNLYGHLFRWYD